MSRKSDREVLAELFSRAADDDCTIGHYEEYQAKEQGFGLAMVIEGDNGKSHGQKGHRKSFLSFEFDDCGKLTGIFSAAPSTKQEFKY